MGEKSVPLSIKLLHDQGMAKQSVFITFLGEMWQDKLKLEHAWTTEPQLTGALFKGDIDAVKKYLPHAKVNS